MLVLESKSEKQEEKKPDIKENKNIWMQDLRGIEHDHQENKDVHLFFHVNQTRSDKT